MINVGKHSMSKCLKVDTIENNSKQQSLHWAKVNIRGLLTQCNPAFLIDRWSPKI